MDIFFCQYVYMVKSKYLNDCIQSLEVLNHHQFKLIWITEDHDIEGIKKAIECRITELS